MKAEKLHECIKILNEIQLENQTNNEQKSSWYVRRVEPAHEEH